jgi:hypothetical protein
MIIHFIRVNDSVEPEGFRNQKRAAGHVQHVLIPRLQKEYGNNKVETVSKGERWVVGERLNIWLDTLEVRE